MAITFFFSPQDSETISLCVFIQSFSQNLRWVEIAEETACSYSSIYYFLKYYWFTDLSRFVELQLSICSFSSRIWFQYLCLIFQSFSIILVLEVMKQSSSLRWQSSYSSTSEVREVCASFSSWIILSKSFSLVLRIFSISLAINRFMVYMSFSILSQLLSMGVTLWNLCQLRPKMQLAHSSFCQVQQQIEMLLLCYRHRIGFLDRIRRLNVSIASLSFSRLFLVLELKPYSRAGLGTAGCFAIFWELGDCFSGVVLRGEIDFLCGLEGLLGLCILQ